MNFLECTILLFTINLIYGYFFHVPSTQFLYKLNKFRLFLIYNVFRPVYIYSFYTGIVSTERIINSSLTIRH
jgi:hypothetical protein